LAELAHKSAHQQSNGCRRPGRGAYAVRGGQYDLVAIAEMPNDETVARMALALGAQGNIRSETIRAFTKTEFRKIAGSLP